MSELEKLTLRIKPLDENSDYRLWRIRVEAACDSKDLSDVLVNEECPFTEDDKRAKFVADQRKASNIIVNAVSNNPLRVIRSEIGNPSRMLRKLDERYDSRTKASKISKMTELLSIRYVNFRKDISHPIGNMAAVLEQLEGMDAGIPPDLAVALVIASIDVEELKPITSAIKVLPDDRANWDEVTAMLIDEYKLLKKKMRASERASALHEMKCEICGKNNHTTDRCFLNPLNPNNKLSAERKAFDKNVDRDKQIRNATLAPAHSVHNALKEKDKTNKEVRFPVKDHKNTGARAAVAKVWAKTGNDSTFMLDSGTTSHLTRVVSNLDDAKVCNVKISLGDNSTVRASHTGTHSVEWNTPDGSRQVNLMNTLASPDLAMELLSIPSLASKGIYTIFTDKRAILIDAYDNYSIIGIAPRGRDGLYYISSGGDALENSGASRQERIMMAIASNNDMSVGDEYHLESDVEYEHSDEERVPILNDDSDSEDYEDYQPPFDDDNGTESGVNLQESFELCNENISDNENRDYSRYLYDHEYEDVLLDMETELFSNLIDANDEVSNDGSPCVHLRLKPIQIWHARLGHTGKQVIGQMMDLDMLGRTDASSVDCESCFKGKYRRRFGGSLTDADRPGSIHADVVGPINPPTVKGHKYFLTVIDEYSRYTEAVPMHRKRDASPCLLEKVNWFERQGGFFVKSVHTDGGKEFLKAHEELREDGVEISITAPRTPQSNGLIERTQGLLCNIMRTCLIQSHVSPGYWNFSLHHAVQCRNIMLHSATMESPHERLFGEKSPHLDYIFPFGCKTLFMPNIMRRKSEKFKPLLCDGVNLGHVRGGLYAVCGSDGIHITKHVKHIETEWPGTPSNTQTGDPGLSATENVEELIIGDSSDSEAEGSDDFDSADDQQDGGDEELENSQNGMDDSDTVPLTYVAPSSADVHEAHIIGNPDPDSRYTLRARASVAMPQSISSEDEPSVRDALMSPERDYWVDAIEEEFKILDEHKTYEDKPSVPENAPIPTGFLLKVKRDEGGKPSRFKGRLVARGNLEERNDLSYADSYAPVACFDTVRILMVLSLAFNWVRAELDLKSAFLYAELPKGFDLWIKLPFIPGIPWADGSVRKLLKSLYGLRHAPKLWYRLLASKLMSIGFARLLSSPCIFIRRESGMVAIILAYVDDLLLFGDSKLVDKVKSEVKSIFNVTDLGVGEFFLGVKIDDMDDGITLSQSALIDKIISVVGLQNAKPCKTPFLLGHPLYEEKSPIPDDEKLQMQFVPYREVLGMLLFLSTRTRPDLSTAVSLLSKFAADPGLEHWKSMKQVVRYLVGTRNDVLFYPRNGGCSLVGWSDADWGRDKGNRRSRSGVLITLNDCPVVWSSQQQTAVATSTAEAEFAALSSCVRDIKWVRELLSELGISQSNPTQIYQDNLGTIAWSADVQGLRKVKHVGLKYAFVKEAVDNGNVVVDWVSSAQNLADPFTKVLVGKQFEYHFDKLLQNKHFPRGGVGDAAFQQDPRSTISGWN